MTLHITLITGEYIQTASDRLVTANRSAHDPRANKSLLYTASDAVVTVGYTGLAYLRGMPTDQLIAQSLAGRDIEVSEVGPYAEPITRRRRWMDIGLATLRLREDLESAFGGRPYAPPFDQHTVMITGYRYDVRPRVSKAWPILWFVSRRDPGVFEIHRRRGRRWPDVSVLRELRVPALVALPAWDLRQVGADDVIAELGSAIPHWEETQYWLADLIRRVSDYDAQSGNPTVGRDVMCTTIFPPIGLYPEVRVRYIPDPERRMPEAGPALGSFSPWLIAPGFVQPPADYAGPMSINLDPVNLLLEGPSRGKAGFSAMYTQPRTPPSGIRRGSTYYRPSDETLRENVQSGVWPAIPGVSYVTPEDDPNLGPWPMDPTLIEPIIVDARDAKPFVEIGQHEWSVDARPEAPEGSYTVGCWRCGALMEVEVERLSEATEGGLTRVNFGVGMRVSEGRHVTTEEDREAVVRMIHGEYLSGKRRPERQA